MTFTFDVSSAADADMNSDAHWYEHQRRGLGHQFIQCVERTFESIRQYPEAHLSVGDRFRRALVRRFPYAVYYRFDGKRIKIYAVLHNHRDPGEWKKRTE